MALNKGLEDANGMQAHRTMMKKTKALRSLQEKGQNQKLDPSNAQKKVDHLNKNAMTGRKERSWADAELKTSMKKEVSFERMERMNNCVNSKMSSDHATPRESTDNADTMLKKPTKDLIREVAVLECEVKHLELHLLSLYRKAFEQQQSSSSSSSSSSSVSRGSTGDHSGPSPCVQQEQHEEASTSVGGKPWDARVHRSQSTISYRAVCSSRMLNQEGLESALRPCQSQPLSFLEGAERNGSSGVVSLADYLGTDIADHIPETPNNLSEEMVRCMAGIYCRIADPPLVRRSSSSPPSSSSFSSASAFSSQSVDSPTSNRDLGGPYCAMAEIASVRRDRHYPSDVEALLQTFKLIVRRLEAVDLRSMRRDERLAFWINIHNALMMHAYLKFGIPQSNLKKSSLLLKAACKIGGRTISAATIRGMFLGCHGHRSGQWLRSMLYPVMRTRYAGERWRGIDAGGEPEPLARFALSTGCRSDPAVRVYTPRRVRQQLEQAKAEFIAAAVASVRPEEKIALPRLLEEYAKDAKMTHSELLDDVLRNAPGALGLAAVQRCRQRGGWGQKKKKTIEWVPHDRRFGYLISRELAS